MITIGYPDRAPLLRKDGGKERVFCRSRKKWVALTPEEWVRQNFLNYLEWKLGYPLSLMAVEKSIRLGELTKRFDLVVFNPSGDAMMVIECKEMNTPLSEDVLLQAIRYNGVLQAPVIIITNGIHCIAVRMTGAMHEFLDQVPAFAG